MVLHHLWQWPRASSRVRDCVGIARQWRAAAGGPVPVVSQPCTRYRGRVGLLRDTRCLCCCLGGGSGRITSGTAGESGGAMLSGLCLYVSRAVDSGDPMRRSGALFDLNCVAQRTIGWCVSLSTPCEASGEVRHVLMRKIRRNIFSRSES